MASTLKGSIALDVSQPFSEGIHSKAAATNAEGRAITVGGTNVGESRQSSRQRNQADVGVATSFTVASN